MGTKTEGTRGVNDGFAAFLLLYSGKVPVAVCPGRSPEEKAWWGGVILAFVLVIPALMPSRHVDCICGIRGEC